MSITDKIFKANAPYANIYQGKDLRVLFVCSAGLCRSATGANLFAKEGWNTRCSGSEEYALIPTSANLITWAHKIFFMLGHNLYKVRNTFKDYPEILNMLDEKSSVLHIPDDYAYNDPELIALLKERVK